jgi:hypothetical protein
MVQIKIPPNAVEIASYGNLTIVGLTNKKQLTNQN